jgi:ATP-dependent protease ClpP protease subunit
MTNKYNLSNTKLKTRLTEEEEFEHERMSNSLGYFVKNLVQNQFTVDIDEPFTTPAYYRNIIQMLTEATEDDIVVFRINSPGGREDSLLALVEAVKTTQAMTVSVIIGECASAASLFVMYTDQVVVTDNARMLCHGASYGFAGKDSDVRAHVNHTAKTVDKLIRNSYKFFLTDAEIADLLDGRELYLDSDEINERFASRQDKYEQEEITQQKALEVPVKKAPVKAPTKKVTK